MRLPWVKHSTNPTTPSGLRPSSRRVILNFGRGFHHFGLAMDHRNHSETQPRWGWMIWCLFPRVAALRQPWAEGHNPFGIEKKTWLSRHVFFLVPKLHLGINLSWQLYCLSDSFPARPQMFVEAVRSQVQLGNEEMRC